MTPLKKVPPKPRLPLPRKPPKVIEPPTVYKRKPKHPKKERDEGGGMRDETENLKPENTRRGTRPRVTGILL